MIYIEIQLAFVAAQLELREVVLLLVDDMMIELRVEHIVHVESVSENDDTGRDDIFNGLNDRGAASGPRWAEASNNFVTD